MCSSWIHTLQNVVAARYDHFHLSPAVRLFMNCSEERDDWGVERQKLLDAVQAEKKQWHEEREQLMKNWVEESEILTQVCSPASNNTNISSLA